VKNRIKLAFLGGVLQVEHQSQGVHLSPRQQPLHITYDLEQLLPHLRRAQVVHHLADTELELAATTEEEAERVMQDWWR